MTARPVPGYLGQILDGGVPVGTCFQVAPGVVVTAWHVRPGLAEAVNEARRARLLAEAAQAYQPVRLGVAAAPELAWLPWEALPRPDGRGPLALHPLVRVYRRASAADPRLVPGPLRIVVAIAAPLDSGGGVVDYERHLRSVIAEVRSARQDDADVRGIPFAVPVRHPRGTAARPGARAARLLPRQPGAPGAGGPGRERAPGRCRGVPGRSHPARRDAAGDHAVGLLHRRGRRRLPALRRELGFAPYTGLLAEMVDDAELAEVITSWLDEWDKADEKAD